MKNLFVVIGTRPEAIKLAPVVRCIQASGWARCTVVLTGQHRDLVEPILNQFGLTVAHDLEVMQPNQSLAQVTARILERFDALLVAQQPDAVIGQGDTASVLAASMACFFRHIPFAHVEAGLRTGNPRLPFPEEMNRVLTSKVADWHFAPTEPTRTNLRNEGVGADRIWVTGNTVIDALKLVVDGPSPPPLPTRAGRDYVLVTAHRRENLGEPMVAICNAIADLASAHPDLDFIFPVHPNPVLRETVFSCLSSHANVLLIDPCDYPVFCWLMKGARLILSDSGGVQEEAPALGKPVLVLRNETERPEAVAVGATQLVGTSRDTIVRAAQALLSDAELYARMAGAGSPYGDGRAALRIVDTLRSLLCEAH